MEEVKVEKSLKDKIIYEVFDLVKTFVVCFVIIFAITKFGFHPIKVDGRSMMPTLVDNEIGAMNVFALNFFGVNRGDVVVVDAPNGDEKWVKRVIGLPNDTVYAKDNQVYINNVALEEPYLDQTYIKEHSEDGIFTEDFQKFELHEGEYFLMGDNRPESFDSRSVGAFKRSDLLANGVFIVYPFDCFGYKGNN